MSERIISPEIQPIIHWIGNIDRSQVTVNHVVENKNYPPLIKREIESKKVEIANTNNAWDGEMLSLCGWSVTQQGLHLEVARTSYSEFIVTNWERGAELWWKTPDLLSDAIVLTTIVKTTDSCLPLGIRAKGLHVGAGQIGLIGGLANTDESVHFIENGKESGEHLFELIELEVREELGIPAEVTNTRMIALARDGRAFRPNIFFVTEVNASSHEVTNMFNRKGNKNEHREIFMIGDTPREVKDFISNTNLKMFTESTKVGLHIYANFYSKMLELEPNDKRRT